MNPALKTHSIQSRHTLTHTHTLQRTCKWFIYVNQDKSPSPTQFASNPLIPFKSLVYESQVAGCIEDTTPGHETEVIALHV